MVFKTINPFSLEQLGAYPALDSPDISQKLESATVAWQSWRRTSLDERIAVVRKLAALLVDRKERYAVLITHEMGKPIRESRIEIQKCATLCLYLSDNLVGFLEPQEMGKGYSRSYVRFDPIGGILGIMPWNFPFWQVFRFALPAMLAGNCALLKHAPNVLGCAEAIEQLLLDAGFPQAVFTSLVVTHENVPQVIAHPFVQAVSFTGSAVAGAKVAALAAGHCKKSILELGGSDPFIVLPDADLDKAVTTAVQSRMINAGQSCIAAKRFIVHEAVFDSFLEHFKGKMERLQLGDPMSEDTDYGPLARRDLADELWNQYRLSVQKGAIEVLEASLPVKGPGLFSAGILSHVPLDTPAAREELFGPVAAFFCVHNFEEAIKVANSSRYGLGASIWTDDLVIGHKMAEQIESGSVYINTLMKSDVALPFGGVKYSGYGRELSEYGLREFTNIKTVAQT